ncbi:MAG: 50S ribosomal protein L10 [Alphaproteobacteria bacterium]
MDRAQKEQLVTSLHEVFDNTNAVVVAHYAGLSVAEMSKLRGEMKRAGATLKVAKNRLVKLALPGTPAQGIAELFQGPTAIAYSDDPVAAPKVAVTFAKENEKFVVLGGAMGATVLDVQGIEALASLPSLDELRGKIAGLVARPAAKIAQVLVAPAGQVARVLNARATKDEAA